MKEYKNTIFELSGKEGADFKNLKVCGFSIDGKEQYGFHIIHHPKNHSQTYYVRVVGFVDKHNTDRNWGYTKKG
jgi:hypothetical protein